MENLQGILQQCTGQKRLEISTPRVPCPMDDSSPTTVPLHDDVPFLGISLAGVQSFIESVGGASALTGLTTTEVVRKYLKPQTAALSGVSFCEQNAAKNFVQRATVFVSHAWSHVFMDLVDALEARDNDRKANLAGPFSYLPEEYFWLDFFCNCQHTTHQRPFIWWATTFADAIAAIGTTVLVLGFEDPKPLSRAWCLFEINHLPGEHFPSRYRLQRLPISPVPLLMTLPLASRSLRELICVRQRRQIRLTKPPYLQLCREVLASTS
jgi:hypothetical protein